MTGRVVFALEVRGLEELKRELRKQKRAFFEEMARALPEEGQSLMQQATAAAPKASGELAGSSLLSVEVKDSKGSVRVAAAFTDDKAAAVHEGVHWGGFVAGTRGFKFYERVFNAFEVGFIERIAQRLRRLTGGGK